MGHYEAIKDALTYGGASVHVYDSATTGEVPDENIYVLLTSQSSTNSSDFRRFRWNAVQAFEIVSKQLGSVSKDIVDDISEQIEAILMYVDNQPGNGGMITQPGWEFQDVILESANYIDFEISQNFYEITKVLQISCIATKIS
jgi:hypothetical protein